MIHVNVELTSDQFSAGFNLRSPIGPYDLFAVFGRSLHVFQSFPAAVSASQNRHLGPGSRRDVGEIIGGNIIAIHRREIIGRSDGEPQGLTIRYFAF